MTCFAMESPGKMPASRCMIFWCHTSSCKVQINHQANKVGGLYSQVIFENTLLSLNSCFAGSKATCVTVPCLSFKLTSAMSLSHHSIWKKQTILKDCFGNILKVPGYFRLSNHSTGFRWKKWCIFSTIQLNKKPQEIPFLCENTCMYLTSGQPGPGS